MPEILISALVQAPFVLAMAYLVMRVLAYIEQRDREWRGFVERRDEQLTEHMDELARSLRDLTSLVVTHDAVVRAALSERPQRVYRTTRERMG